MNRLLRTHIAVAMSPLLWACGTESSVGDLSQRSQVVPSRPQLVSADTPSQLGGEVAFATTIPNGPLFNADALRQKLSDLSDSSFELTELPDRHILQSADFQGFISKQRRAFSIVRDDEAIAKPTSVDMVTHLTQAGSPNAVVHPDDDAMLQTATELTRLLGASDEEMEDKVVRTVAVEESSGNEITIATKVFIFRRVSGIPVPADRSVVTFDPAGKIRSMRGTWGALGPPGRQVETKLITNEEEFLDAAISTASAKYPNFDQDWSTLRVRTFFDYKQGDEASGPRLFGEVVVPIENGDGEEAHTMLKFDL